jgi:uncharacterized protein YegL
VRVTPEQVRLFDEALQARNDRPAEAVRILRGLGHAGVRHPAVVGTLGAILFHDLHDPGQALPYLRRSVRVSPASEVSSLALCHALVAKGRRPGAAAEARRFLGLRDSPGHRLLLEELGPVGPSGEAPRLGCLLAIDTSTSMGPLRERLAAALDDLKERLAAQPATRDRLDVALATFDAAPRCGAGFRPASAFHPPCLPMGGPRHLADALRFATTILREQLQDYAEHGARHHRPWLLLLTSGGPEGETPAAVAQAARLVQSLRAEHQANVFPVVVSADTDLEPVRSVVGVTPRRMGGSEIAALFAWLYEGLARVANAPDVVASIGLPAPTWGAAR